MPTANVAVVGAGPAGAWTAYRLARSGARVTLFDPSHPREKPCGGGVTGRAMALVADAVDPAGLPAVPVETVRFEENGRSMCVAVNRSPATPPALYVLDRRSFDGALLQAARTAGAELVSERVLDVAAGASGVELRTRRGSYTADALVGADGPGSLVRRRLSAPFRRAQLSLATGFFVHGASSREIVVRFEGEPPGYLWSFPRPTHFAVGICAQASRTQARALRARAAAWLGGGPLGPGLALEPYSWPIPSLPAGDFDRECPAGDRWMLAGDAAGLVDPLTREGIYFALASAEHAAHALLSGGRGGCVSYAARVRDEIHPELHRAARLTAGFFRPSLTALLLEALAESAAVRDVMCDLIAGRQPYATLVRRLLATLEVGLAWRLLMVKMRSG